MTLTTDICIKHFDYASPPGDNNFVFPYKVTKEVDLLVVHTSAVGLETTLTNPAEWSVTLGLGTEGGVTVTLIPSLVLVSGEKLTVKRDPAMTQEDYVARHSGGWSPTQVEGQYDRIAMQLQSLGESISRALLTSVASEIDGEQQLIDLAQDVAELATVDAANQLTDQTNVVADIATNATAAQDASNEVVAHEGLVAAHGGRVDANELAISNHKLDTGIDHGGKIDANELAIDVHTNINAVNSFTTETTVGADLDTLEAIVGGAAPANRLTAATDILTRIESLEGGIAGKVLLDEWNYSGNVPNFVLAATNWHLAHDVVEIEIIGLAHDGAAVKKPYSIEPRDGPSTYPANLVSILVVTKAGDRDTKDYTTLWGITSDATGFDIETGGNDALSASLSVFKHGGYLRIGGDVWYGRGADDSVHAGISGTTKTALYTAPSGFRFKADGVGELNDFTAGTVRLWGIAKA